MRAPVDPRWPATLSATSPAWGELAVARGNGQRLAEYLYSAPPPDAAHWLVRRQAANLIIGRNRRWRPKLVRRRKRGPRPHNAVADEAILRECAEVLATGRPSRLGVDIFAVADMLDPRGQSMFRIEFTPTGDGHRPIRQRIIEVMGALHPGTVKEAAQARGVGERTIKRWRKRIRSLTEN